MTSTSIYQSIVPTYLYIKQHSVTKKKYFGKTTRDPYKYNGSGEYWSKHIKKHGKEHIVTLWVSDLYYDTSIVDIALHFSFDNNIVESKEWANLEPENGLNGGASGRKFSEESKAKLSVAKKGISRSEETKAKMSAAMKGVPKPPRTAEHCAKISARQKGVPKPELSARQKGVPLSEETKAKISTAMKGVPKPEGFGAKVSAAMKGVPKPPRTAEHKAKLRVPKSKFFSIIETRKTYDKGNLSRHYPEFKQYY